MILHLSKLLKSKPPTAGLPRIGLRSFDDQRDVEAWLQLRQAAFAGQSPPVGRWAPVDLRREILDRWWWRPERTLVAVDVVADRLVGSVTLASPYRNSQPVAAVHWLMVDPDWQGRGIGRQLLAHVEYVAWVDGFRELHVETHAGWTRARSIYEKAGYREELATAGRSAPGDQ